MLNAVPALSNDEKAFLKVMINSDKLSTDIANYGRLVSASAPLRKQILAINRQLERYDVTFDQIKDDPRFAEAAKVHSVVRDTRTDAIRKFAQLSDMILPELQKMRQGIDLVRTLDVCTPFLKPEQNEGLRALEQVLDSVKEHHIFVKHGITTWPREFSNVRVQPLLAQYREIVSRALDVVRNPPPASVPDSAVVETPFALENTISSDRGLRRQALIDTHLPESMRDQPELKSISASQLKQRINTILKLTDNSAGELHQICERHPEVILNQVAFGRLVRRASMLNRLGLRDPLDKRSAYDPILSHDIRAQFLDRLLALDDKRFFETYAKLRVAVAQGYLDPNKLYPVIDSAFVAKIFPAASHPLLGQDLTPAAVTKFLKSGEFFVWKSHEITEQALKRLILDKISGRHVSAPREDWIKANFSVNSSAGKMLEHALDSLISKGNIRLTNPSNSSKSGLQLAR